MAEFAVNIYENAKSEINDIVEAISQYESERVWAEMLIRGIHPDYDIFYPELYSKYFVQVRSVNMFKKPVRSFIIKPEMPSHKLNTGSKKVTYYDKQKFYFTNSLQSEVYSDLIKYFGDLLHDSGKKLYETFPFGHKDLKRNFIVYIPENEFKSIVEVKKYKTFKDIGKIRKWNYSIDIKKHRDLLGIGGKVKLLKDSKASSKVKVQFDAFSNETELIELVMNPEITIPQLFIPVTKEVIDGGD